MAQVDLEKRVHRNQSPLALGKMAFAIMQTFINRKIELGKIDIKRPMHDEMIQYRIVENEIRPEIEKIMTYERPPMLDVPEYRQKYGLASPP